MEPWEVMISESQERMLATCTPGAVPGRARGLRALGNPHRAHRSGGHRTATSRSSRAGSARTASPNPGAKEMARIPAKALTSEADRPRPAGHAPDSTPRGAGPGHPAHGPGRAARAWHGSGRGSGGAARQRQPLEPPLGLRAVRRLRPEQHRRVARPRSGRPARQGHAQGASSRPRTATRASARIDPHLGAQLSVAEATRNVSITGARPLGHHQLPQLRQSRAARSVLAAAGSRPRHGRRLPRPRRRRSPAATCRSTTSIRAGPSRRRRRSASWV